MNRRVTLKDISDKTGFAKITVSKALRNHTDISKETRAFIQKTANDMGYIRNANASNLRSGRTNTIALIIADLANPFFAIITKQAEKYAEKLGYVIIVMNTDEDIKKELAAVKTAISMNVDGILLFSSQKSREPIEIIENAGVPCVLMAREFENSPFSSVIFDDFNAGYIATEHLIKSGFRNILMLSANDYNYSSIERYRGYVAAHKDYGIDIDKNLHIYIGSLGGSCNEVFENISRDSFDAVLAYNDMLALEVIEILKDKNINVPKDVAVAGFDDIGAVLPYLFPLTTVTLPTKLLAKLSIDKLNEIITEKSENKTTEKLAVNLNIRQSTKKAQY